MKFIIPILIICFAPSVVFTQVSISSSNTSPDSSAMLDIQSTDKGLLIPRMDSTQRQEISDPAPGLMVFDTTTMSFWYYVDSWKEGLGIDDKDWKREGNIVYNDSDSICIGMNGANAEVQVAGGKDVLFGDDLTGSGFKAIYYANKGAFRCGYLTNPFGGYNYDKFWDYDSVGYYSWAGGQNSRAKGFGAFAFGSFGWADGSGSVAFFGNAKGNNSFTFGGSSKGRGSITFEGTAEDEGGIAMYGYAGGRYGVSIGGGTTGLGASSALEDYSVAIGWNSDARGQASIALGPSDAYGYNAFSTGWVTEARGNYSSTFGYRTNSYPYVSMALGRYNLASGDSAAWVGNDPIFMIGNGSSNSNRSNCFLIQKNGQTAVGYNAPTGMLNVSTDLGSINSGGNLDAAKAGLLIGTSSNGIAFDANQMESIGSSLFINFNSSEDIILATGGGNVGIATEFPDRELTVFDNDNDGDAVINLKASNSSDREMILAVNQGSGGIVGMLTDNDLYFRTNATNRMVIESNGEIGIGTTNPTALLEVNSSVVKKTGGGSWTASSDKRLKQNIQDYQEGLEEILEIRPVQYQYNDLSGNDTSEEHIGVIAQELKKVAPYMISSYKKDGEEYLQVDNSAMMYMLINAVKELSQKIEFLESELQSFRTNQMKN